MVAVGVAVVAMTTVDAVSVRGSGVATAGRKIGEWGREILPRVPTLQIVLT